MTRSQLITKLSSYFLIEELVDKKTYKAHGQRAWKFFSIELLETMLIVREDIGLPITVNNWHKGGRFSQRGLRTNISPMVLKKSAIGRLYLSAHMMGKALDFDVKGMNADEVRKWFVVHRKELPHKIRLENKINKTGKTISWVHLDVIDESHNEKVYLFNI